MKKLIQRVLLGFCSVWLLPQAGAWEINREFDTAPGGELVIDTDIGSLEVSSHDKTTVSIAVRVEGIDEEDLKLTFRELEVGVSVRGDARRRWYGRAYVEFDVRVPVDYDVSLSTAGGGISVLQIEGQVDVDTSGGSLDIESIAGDVHGHTSGGSVRVRDVEGAVRVDTSGGQIDITRVTGDVRADTSGGSITVSDVGGRLDAETSGGGIRIEAVAGGIDASTSGGPVRAGILRQPAADVSLATSGGSVTVMLAEDVGMDLDARGRRVRSDFPVGGVTSAKRRLIGPVNGGGPVLELRSSGGGVYVERD